MKKKIFIIFIIVVIILSVGIIYLNQVILPVKIKSLIVSGLETATQKKVTLQGLQFSIFKGLVLRDLIIYNEQRPMVSLKEGSCTFLIWPIFQKKLIIPVLRFKSPEIFLQRRADSTFNIQDLFSNKATLSPQAKFGIFIYRISLTDGNIHFQDDTLSPAFNKDLKDVNLVLYLSLPASVKFTLKSEIPAPAAIKINATGEYKIVNKQLISQIKVKDFSPQEFQSYYRNLGIAIPEGTLDALIDLKYSLATKQLEYCGEAAITKLEFSGLEFPREITDLNGQIKFNNSGLSADKLRANVLEMPVEAKISLIDFQAPVVQMDLFSQDLRVESNFQFKDKLIIISKCNGQYLNSPFSLQGTIDTANPGRLEAAMDVESKIDLKDIKGPLKKFQKQLEQIKPEGIIQAKFNLKGNLNDFKSCAVKGKLSSSSLSLYGLKATEVLLDYNQADGLVDISPVHLSVYDGTIEASAKMNLNSENLPYWISADIQGVKLEKLKLDAAKDKDIAGTIAAGVKLNGFSNDLSKLNGAGQVNITEGKLWQLDLFKGLGSLLFARDFSQIIFNEGSCTFSIQDKYIFSDNLRLKSNITDLTGSAKIGFDSSIDASLNVQILDEMVPLSGTFKDITTAILGQTGRFGTIKITGTLKEPKYKFKPAVANIIKGIKDILFGNTEE